MRHAALVMLVVAGILSANVASAASYYWSSAGTAGGAYGVWDTTGAYWGAASGGPYTGYWTDTSPGNVAVFQGTAGTVTIPAGETRAAAGLTFSVADYGVTGGTISLDNGGSAATITLPNVNLVYNTIDSVITGGGGIIMATNNRAGLLLTGANSYTGPTTVNNGRLIVYNDSALGAAGGGNETILNSVWASVFLFNNKTDGTTALTVAEDFTLKYTPSEPGAIFPNYSVGGNNTFNLTGAVTLSNTNSVIAAYYGTSLTMSGPINIGGTAKTLSFAGRGEGFQSTTNQLAGAVFTLRGDVSGNGNIASSEKSAHNYCLAGNTATTTYRGLGTVVLSGNNSYTGATTVGIGATTGFATFVVKSNNALGTTAGTTTVNTNSALQLDAGTAGGSLALAENITINGQGTPTFTGLGFVTTGMASYTSVVVDTGALRNVKGNNSLSGQITLGSAARINCDQDTLTIGGNIANGAYLLTVGGTANTMISGAIGGAGTAGGLTKDGSGTLTLTGANTYTGATTVSGGTLQLGDVTTNGAIAGTSIVDNAALVFNCGVSTSPTYGGLIGGTGTFTKTGAGTLTLSGANAYAGLTTLSDGTLVLVGQDAVSAPGAWNPVFDFGGANIAGGQLVFDYASGIDPATTITGLLGTKIYTTVAGRKIRLTDDEVNDRVILALVAALFPGDADGNGTVNGADLNVVLSNYNQSGMDWGHGDFDGNGTVNGADLNVVLSNYNQSAPVTAAVPEPSMLLLAAAGLTSLLAYGWRKRK